jgi:hypothetical protein
MAFFPICEFHGLSNCAVTVIVGVGIVVQVYGLQYCEVAHFVSSQQPISVASTVHALPAVQA